MKRDLTVDDLKFEIRWSPRRKTVELAVERHGELVIRAPEGTSTDRLAAAVKSKKFWLYSKIAEKASLRKHDPPAKEFVSGEGFHYLGRSYRLLLVAAKAQRQPLKLEQGRFKLIKDEADRGLTHFVRWYTEHARPWLTERVTRFAPRVGVEPARVEVRDLGYRWGSCGQNGTLNFHWKTILLPPSIVEYVVAHELVHLREDNHTPEFWMALERSMPDFEVRKRWLAANGVEFTAL